MTQPQPLADHSLAARLVMAQFAITLVLALGAWGLLSLTAGYSAFLGGAICVVANGYFAWRAFKEPAGATQAGRVLTAFYLGEIGKFAITALLLVVVLIWVSQLHVPAFLAAYSVALIAPWFVPLIHRHRR